MPTIRFDRHPATITIGDGLAAAFRYWRASWMLWILPVAAMVLVNGLAYVAFGSTTIDPRAFESAGAGTRAFVMPALAPSVLAGPLAVALVSLVVDWFLTAIAVAGLRGRPITADWVIGAGLRTFVAELLTGFVALAVSLVIVVVAVAAPVVLIGLFLLVPIGVYVLIRITFWNLAIFDGAGVLGGFDLAWRISRDSVLRMLGWGIVVALLGIALTLGTVPFTILFAVAGVPVVGTTLAAAVSAPFRAYTMIALAVLYESQRWRYAPPVVPAAPAAPVSPLGPPPPPPPPPWYGPQG